MAGSATTKTHMQGGDFADTVTATVAQGDPHVRIRPLKCAKIAERFNLTPRETDMLEHLSKGCTTPYIASELGISEQTVKTHTRHIYNKLGVHKRQQLIDLVENTPKF